MQPKRIALLSRDAALDKKAENPVILDVGKLTSVARYFVITHGNSDRHVKAIAENIIDTAKSKHLKVYHREGLEDGRWVLLDLGNVLVHVFYRETRDFFGLERLWGDAKKV